jgi:dipeptidyl aminopeptidase/acylaminoacyl peptidase
MTNLERLLRIPRVDGDHSIALSPDEATAAFSWNLTGRWELYTCPIAGSTDPQIIQPGLGSRFNPQFSPVNSQQLICAADFDGSESFHLLLLDLSSGETVDLTPGDCLQPNFAWSPDGAEVAYLSSRSGCFDAYLLNLATRQTRLIAALGHPIWDVTWSPDGRHLALTAETSGSDYGVYLVDLDSNVSRRLTLESQETFDSIFSAKDPSFSPDGQTLAFSATRGEFFQIGLYHIASRQITWLTATPGDKTSPAWDKTGQRLTYIHSSGATNRIAVHPLTSHSSLITHSLLPGSHTSPQFTPDGQNLLFIFDNPQSPPDLWLLSLETGHFRPLTVSLPADVDKNALPMPVEIVYPGLDDGIQVPALLYRPATIPAPAVVNIHGGPNWHYSLSWNPLMTHLASLGWVVLAPNYRGSTGYGRTWQTANYKDMGGCDARDVAAGAQYLIRAGLVEPGKIAITGRSHGGFLTMSCLTQYPELWAAGSGVVPFFDWLASHSVSREDLQHWNIENMGDPVENEVLWYERSPYNFLDRVAAPVQIICGGLDPRCPPSDSIAARDKLLTLGKSVEFWLYPDEGHSFLQMENVLQSEFRRAEFLARALSQPCEGSQPSQGS